MQIRQKRVRNNAAATSIISFKICTLPLFRYKLTECWLTEININKSSYNYTMFYTVFPHLYIITIIYILSLLAKTAVNDYNYFYRGFLYCYTDLFLIQRVIS